MKQRNYKQKYSPLSSRGGISLDFIITMSILGVVIIILVVGWYFFGVVNQNKVSNVVENDDMKNEELWNSLQAGGKLLDSGDPAAAAALFQELLDEVENPLQEGQIKLNLAVSRLRADPGEAVEMLKEISLNKDYAPLGRAKAANYVLAKYEDDKDDVFAREHIFTGPVWSEFLVEGEPFSEAMIRGLEFSQGIYPTPETNMRLATEYSRFLFGDLELTQEEKDARIEKALQNITYGDELLEKIFAAGKVGYGDTHYTEVAIAYQRKAMALDLLYFAGHVDNPKLVTEAYEDALYTLIQNKAGSSIELFVRYLYADFLIRLDDENKEATIAKILTPFSETQNNQAIGNFLRNQISYVHLNSTGKEKLPVRPDNIVRLAEISPEFKLVLQNAGVTDQQIELARESNI